MKTLLCALLLLFATRAARGQQPLRYTVWADGLVNVQLAKSSLYGVGAGLRAELSRPLGNPTRALTVQAGYAHFFRKSANAFTADVALLGVGYRYQSRRAFGAAVGVGAQYWREQLRVRFADGLLAGTLGSVRPTASIAFGLRLKKHYHLELENRLLLLPESGTVRLADNAVLALGYTF